MRAEIKTNGLTGATRLVLELGQRARYVEIPLRHPRTLRDLHDSERRRFSHARGWKRISPEWVARKRAAGLDERIMRATGRLEELLTTGGRGQVRFDAYNATLRWGLPWRSEAFYAAAQADAGRRSVIIDRRARVLINARVQRWLASGRF